MHVAGSFRRYQPLLDRDREAGLVFVRVGHAEAILDRRVAGERQGGAGDHPVAGSGLVGGEREGDRADVGGADERPVPYAIGGG
jgi:hypothetical protein